MHIVFHIGAHCTNDDRLTRSLLRNADTLRDRQTATAARADFGPVLRDAVTRLQGAAANSSEQVALLRRITGRHPPRRLILSNDSFVSVPDRALGEGQLYPRMFKAAWLRNVFADHHVSFAMALRDPATFVPALYHRAGGERDFARFLGGTDPLLLRWSDPIRTLLELCPDADLTLWCFEDSPFVWEEVLRATAGIAPETKISGGYDIARSLMSREGVRTMRAALAKAPPADRAGRHRVVAEFLDRFAVPERLEEDVALPGWDARLMAELTAHYEADLGEIARLPRVRVVTR